MHRPEPRTLARFPRRCLLLLLLLPFTVDLAGPFAVQGRPDGPLPSPEAVWPLEGATVVESALRFEFVRLADAPTHVLLLSETPFVTSGMTLLPPPGGPIRVVPARGVSVGGTEAGLVARDGDRYWAVAALDAAGRLLGTSDVRRVRVTPAWQVSSPASPLVRRESSGRVPAERLRPASRRLRLAAGFDFDTRQGEPRLAAPGRAGRPAADDERESWIVQFESTPTDADRRALQADGALPVAPLPDDAWLVRVLPRDRARLARIPGVAWLGAWHPAYRMSPALADIAPSGEPRITVLLFPDAPLGRERARLEQLGARVETASDNGINRLLRLRLPAGRLLEAAALPGVQWIEPYVAPTVGNASAQWVVQTNVNGNRKIFDQGIDGTGQIVHNSDSGITTTHDQFRDPGVPITAFGDYTTHRKIIAYRPGSLSPSVVFGDHAGASFHGTHTAGTVAGNDGPAGGASASDGMARGARIFFHDLSGPLLANSIDHFSDLNDLYQEAYDGNAAGAPRISTNSWGSSTGGAYTVSCLQVDQFAWAHKDFLIFFSNGNSGAVNTVGSPATAKNLVGAGGTQNGLSANLIYASTSRGPTDDNRRKPLVCSPGQSVVSADGNTASGYKALSGTSMACPTQAGEAVLIRQYLADGWYPTGAPVPANGFEPSAALLKALVANSADNGVSGFTAPDNNIGYGRVMADNVLYFPGDARRLVAIDHQPGLEHGESIEYEIQVTSNAIPLEVTLCWTDYPSSPSAGVQLVNDLNLSISNGVNTWKGNVYSGGVSVTGGSFDNRNVEEACLVSSPAVGTWTVRIEGVAVPVGPQPFGLAITGAVDGGSGTLYLDRAEYGSTGTVQLKVIDTNATSPVAVQVTSTSEPTGETVLLTGGDGVFTGTLPLAPWTPGAPHAPGGAFASLGFDVADDTLRVSHGDLLSATYEDDAPVATLVAEATVALEQPTMTGVGADSRGSTAAVIRWTTDLNATSTVYWGLTPALELGTLVDSTAVQNHELLVDGLTTGLTYYYDVESVGLKGNLVRDDNGGAHYRVTIDPPADILLVVGDAASFDRLEAWEEAIADAGWSLDIWEGALADSAPLGDLTGGLRSYTAVLWQVGFEQYPPFSDTQRDRVTEYLAGGGRLLVVSHDVAWSFGDATSSFYSIERRDWLRDVLRTTWQADPATWSQVRGIASDPISGSYTGGVSYTPVRAGAAGDEIDVVPGTGTGSYVWRNNEATADDIGFRWVNGVNDGDPDSALWGGQPSRLATMYFEWTAINPPFTTPNAARTDILDRTIIWLIGRDRPAVVVTAPNGGETVTADSLDIAWTELVDGGAGVARRTLEYSDDGGDSWTLVADSVGASPYRWGFGSLPNRSTMRVRVRVEDDGAPPLSGTDASNADFDLQRPSADVEGPLVVPGSPDVAPNPVTVGDAGALTAVVTDAARGNLAVTAAEFSRGAAPAAAGTGTAMTGAFGTPEVAVSGALTPVAGPAGPARFWIRGRDAADNWGPAVSFDIQVNPELLPVVVTHCPSDTVVLATGPVLLDFAVENAGTAADSVRWTLVDATPGGNIELDGGPLAGTVWLDPADTAFAALPPVSVTVAPGAWYGETTTLAFIARADADSASADSCGVLVTFQGTSAAIDAAPVAFGTGPATPNPFHAGARLHFALDAGARAELRIFGADGRLVRTLIDRPLEAGRHAAEWDGRDDAGRDVPSGLYFYRLTTDGGRAATGRVLRVR
jgi:hypothetical protein